MQAAEQETEKCSREQQGGAPGRQQEERQVGVRCSPGRVHLPLHGFFSFHLLRENKRQKDSRRTTMMLVVVIGFFLTTEIPLLVITVLHTLDNRLGLTNLSWNTLSLPPICSNKIYNFFCNLNVKVKFPIV